MVCFFAWGLYDLATISSCLEVLGLDWDQESLEEFGKETLRCKYAFKVREGFDLEKLRIPRRITETPHPPSGG